MTREENEAKKTAFADMAKEINSSEEIEYLPKELIIEKIKNNPDLLKYVVEELKNDKEVVLTAVKQDGTF